MQHAEKKKISGGIDAGEFVAVFSGNLKTAVKIAVSLINKRFTVVPLNPALGGERIGKYLSAVGCSKIVSDGSMPADFSYECKIFDKTEMSLPGELFQNNSEIRNIFRNIRSDCKRYANIIFTSGSSGMPKAVMHTLGNHYYSSLGSNANIKFSKKDKWLIVLPIYHISGLSVIFRAALSGGEIAVKEPGMGISEALEANRPSHVSLVPHQLRELLNDGKSIDSLRRLKAVLIGGASMPESLAEQAYECGLNLFVSYGSTEMCSQITCTRDKDSLKHLKTSGRLLRHREIKVNEKKNILAKGQTLFAGYLLKNKDGGRLSLEKKLDGEGYFDTGDYGYLDDEGYLHVEGRRDISFRYKAEKIYPEEIEKVFLKIKGIKEAVVVPYKKNDYEKIPVIFIKTDNIDKYGMAHIKRKAEKELEPYKFPHYFFKWPDCSEVLKPSREEMQKTAQEIIEKKIKERFFYIRNDYFKKK